MSLRVKRAEENDISLEGKSAYALKTMTFLTVVGQQLRRTEAELMRSSFTVNIPQGWVWDDHDNANRRN